MKLVVVGVNHKTASVHHRERLSFGADLPDAIASLRHMADFGGAVIVSTCNRSEIYISFNNEPSLPALASEQTDTPNISVQAAQVRTWLAQYKGVALAEILPFLYTYEDERALNHWLRVAAGLDSMILGEPQILGQIRTAVSVSKDIGGMDSGFDWLTQQVFAAARTIRRDTKVGEQAVTLGYAAAKLVTQIFDDPTSTTLLIVAAGEMNRLVAHNVAALGMHRIIIANRSLERADTLKDELIQMSTANGKNVQIDTVGLDALPDVLIQADVVSSCSGSMNTLIDVGMVKAAQKSRKYRPMLLVDLAVPRDIEPSVAKLDDIYLYSVDDLQHVIAGNIEERKQAAIDAELLASQLTINIESQMQLITARRLISDYRHTAHAHKDRLLASYAARLHSGQDPDTVLHEFAHALTQTLTHAPSRLIRSIATDAEPTTLDMVVNGLKSYRQ